MVLEYPGDCYTNVVAYQGDYYIIMILEYPSDGYIIVLEYPVTCFIMVEISRRLLYNCARLSMGTLYHGLEYPGNSYQARTKRSCSSEVRAFNEFSFVGQKLHFLCFGKRPKTTV